MKAPFSAQVMAKGHMAPEGALGAWHEEETCPDAAIDFIENESQRPASIIPTPAVSSPSDVHCGLLRGRERRFNVSPTLVDILQDPRRVMDIPLEAVPPLLCQLSAIQSALAARLMHSQAFGNSPPAAFPEHDHLLTVQEAATKLGVSEDWLYRRAGKLPFTVRLGPHRLRFSAQGMDRYIRHHQGRSNNLTR